MNFQLECADFRDDSANDALKCEEQNKDYIITFYRNNTADPQYNMTIPTTTMRWNPSPGVRMMWFNTSYRHMNDWVEQRLEVPLDLWDFDYIREGDVDPWRKMNISIEFSGSHIEMWYNWYKVCHIWLRDQAEDVTYSTHVKLTGFYGEKRAGDKPGSNASIFWYYRDESLWCWHNCSLPLTFNFTGYYDEVLTPREEDFQEYLAIKKEDRCLYYNCTAMHENYPRCLALNMKWDNGTELVDLRCVNQTYNLTAEVEKAQFYHKNMRPQKENQSLTLDTSLNVMVTDDITGVGLRNGVYSCLNRDYCHDRRSFQVFNSGPSLFRKLWAICICFVVFNISCILADIVI